MEIGRKDLFLVDLSDGEGTRLLAGGDSVESLFAEKIEEIRWYFSAVLRREEDEEIEGAPEIIKVEFPEDFGNEKPSIKLMRPTQFIPADALFGQGGGEDQD